MSTDLFVSYSSRDRDRVMPLVEALRESGISIWIDEGNIHAADLWSEVIVQAIADATVIIVMLSRYSTDSQNVVKEVMLASEQNKTILPIYLEPAEIPPKLQYQLAGIQHIEITNQDLGSVVNTITAGLSKRGISGDENNLQKQAAHV
ncbi:toll/interleukin-1 receptor domain-containing protein, partial [Verrucomicrobia bacterium]|nr:toll/interleukin-1 receptor domain-containing protein [Verrucomicrobiota bacterium]